MEKTLLKLLENNIAKLTRERCHGCKIDHPSQTQHSCLTLDSEDHINVYFEEAWNRINFKEILNVYKKYFQSLLVCETQFT